MKPGRNFVSRIYAATFSLVLNVSNQIVVTLCVFVMAHVLKKSVRFRTTSSGAAHNQKGRAANHSHQHTTSKGDNQKSSTRNTTHDRKEKLVIVQVTLVCIIFLVCNFIRLRMASAARLEPRFHLQERFHNTYLLCYNLMVLFEYFNSCVNFFVYYKYNAKFRSLCFSHKK